MKWHYFPKVDGSLKCADFWLLLMFYWNLPRSTYTASWGAMEAVAFHCSRPMIPWSLDSIRRCIYKLQISYGVSRYPMASQSQFNKKNYDLMVHIHYIHVYPICHGFSIPVSHGPNGFRWAVCSHFAPRPALPTSRVGGRISAAWRRFTGDGWRSGTTCGKRWAKVGVSREKYVEFTDFTGKCLD